MTTTKQRPIGVTGVTLSEDFVAAVHRNLPPKLRLFLWLMWDLTRSVDLQRGLEITKAAVDDAIRRAPAGRNVTLAMLPELRRRIIQALLGLEGTGPGRDPWEKFSPLPAAPGPGPPPGPVCPD